ncbi:MAG: type IV secretion system DNA-binding domain-containing protein [Gammaproteobacteria bacterium]|nr:type IV secretion system DNA-binding domain-containing protein [Gammaproteobacteria bacterium]
MDASNNPGYYNTFLFPFVLTLFSLGLSFWLVAGLTWSWSMPLVGLTGFGDIDNHMPYLADGLATIFGLSSGGPWADYWFQMGQRGVLGSFYAHMAIPLILSLTVASVVMKWSLHYFTPKDIHLRGLQYLQDVKRSVQVARQTSLLEIRQGQRRGSLRKRGLRIHREIPLSFERESRGFLMAGSSGSGKSRLLFDLLDQVIKDKHRCLIHDKKGEYTSGLDVPEFTLVAPWDERGVPWHIAADIRTKSDARVFSEFIISESRDPMWSKAAQQILAGVITHLINTNPGRWNFADLRNAISQTPKTLSAILASTSPEAVTTMANLNSREGQGGQTGQGIMINLQSEMSAIYDLAEAWPGSRDGFSVRQWLEDDYSGPRMVILQGSESHGTIASSLHSALITIAISEMADAHFPEVRQRQDDYRVFYFLDELDTLKPIQKLKTLISVCRSKGAIPVIGIQDKGQINEKYGRDTLNTWFSQLGTKFIGFTSPGDTANWFANEMIGKREIMRYVHGQSLDTESNRLSVSTHPEKRDSIVIMASQLSTDLTMGEKSFTGLLVCTGWPNIHRLEWKKRQRLALRAAVVRAHWAIPQEAVVQEQPPVPPPPRASHNDQLCFEGMTPTAAPSNESPPDWSEVPGWMGQDNDASAKKKTRSKKKPAQKKTANMPVRQLSLDETKTTSKTKRLVIRTASADRAEQDKDSLDVRQQKARYKADLLRDDGLMFSEALKKHEQEYIAGMISESDYERHIVRFRQSAMEVSDPC